MVKAKKEKTAKPDKYQEKVALDMDFTEAIKMFALHANTKGAKKITYAGRERVGQ